MLGHCILRAIWAGCLEDSTALPGARLRPALVTVERGQTGHDSSRVRRSRGTELWEQ